MNSFTEARLRIFLVAIILAFAGFAKAQSYTPVDYRFFDSSAAHRVIEPDSSDLGIDLRAGTNVKPFFTSVASNGYGTWAANTDGNWFLMSNEYNPVAVGSIDAHGAVAMGSMGSGNFAEAKVATNLKGRTRFVYPVADRDSFMLYGINDDIPTSPSPSFDIKFNGIPKASNSRDPFKGNATVHGTSTGTLVYGSEVNWRDAFDVAMDEKYTYIVWQSLNTGTSQFEIWVTAVVNSSGITVTNFPKQITNLGTGKPISGKRPTISCDVRHNSGGSTSPRFDVAFIDSIPTIGGTAGGQIWHAFYNSGAFTLTMQPLMVKRSTGSAVPYSMPMHVRMLTGSIAGGWPSAPAKGIYAIVDGGTSQTDGDLIIHRITGNITTGAHAFYVDGANPVLGVHQAPLDSLNPSTDDFAIWNSPIVGLANPYDGEANDVTHDEFHCAYELRCKTSVLGFPMTGCMIVRGNNNGLNGTPDTRTILNRSQDIADPAWRWVWTQDPNVGSLTAGVNQMGIHVYWNATTVIPQAEFMYYIRDERRFDEDIEENTLVSKPCYVADGTSHQGSSSPTLLPGKIMTLWSDLISGVEDTLGDYTPFDLLPGVSRNKQLFFEGDSVTLNIGLNDTASVGSTFITLPNYGVVFSDPTQKLIINQASEYICYGFEFQNYETSEDESYCGFRGGGALELKGRDATVTGGTHGFADTLTRPAVLTIKPGAELRLSQECNFKAEQSLISIPYDRSIYPPFSPPNDNPYACGKLTAHGKLTLTECKVLSDIESGGAFDIIHVKPCFPRGSCSTTTNQTTITNSLIQNETTDGKATIRFTNYYSKQEGFPHDSTVAFRNQRPQRISGGKFDNASIACHNPLKSFDVLDAVFDNIHDTAIRLIRTEPNEGYNSINIKENKFVTFVDDADAAISFTDFDEYIYTSPSSTTPRIMIEESICTTTTTHSVEAAIKLTRSAAAVLENTVTGTGYKIGIRNDDADAPTSELTHTFMCDNEIRNCSEAGIFTDKWLGYIKTSTINENNKGYVSGEDDDGGIVGTFIEDNDSAGVQIINVNATVNISGVHGGEDENDYSSSNSIKHNNQVLHSGSGQVQIKTGTLLMGNPGGGFLNFGHNNIIRNGSGDNFIFGTSSTTAFVDNMDSNYWGGYDVDSDNDGDDTFLPGFATFADLPVADLFSEQTVPNYSCSMGLFGNKSNKNKILSIQDNGCSDLYARGYGYAHSGPFQKGYDTLRFYIETCALEKDSWKAFTTLSGANFARNEDDNRYKEYREWLKKVLYYSSDTLYYCSDANAIINTFAWFDSVRGDDIMGAIAVIEYLLESGKCPMFVNNWKPDIQSGIDIYINGWRDTVQDSIKTPLDTSRPTLEELDLTVLYGPQGNVPGPIRKERTIDNLSIAPNPTREESTVHYFLNEGSVVRCEVFDALGRTMYSAGLGYKSQGKQEIQLPSRGWDSGTYYVRLGLLSGEIRTVKLVKE